MKKPTIESVRTYRLQCRLAEPFGFSQGFVDRRQALLVEIVDSEGTSGWGECFGPAETIQAGIASWYAPMLLGQNPLNTEVLWHTMWRRFLDFARRGIMMAAISGLDMALWDYKGKRLGLSVAELLGGRFRDSVPCYATGMYFRQLPEDKLLDALIEEAAGHSQAGFKLLKFKVGKNLPFDLQLITAARKAFPYLTLMADANHALDLPEAIRVGRCLDEQGFSWFEEPLSPEHASQFRQLQDKLDLSLATGECEQTRFGFQSLLAAGGVHIAQPDLAFCGGLSEGVKIRALASAMGINVVPHVWGTMLNMAAATHFLASTFAEPGRAELRELPLECDRSPNPLRDDIFATPMQIHDGRAQVPTTPGLGVSVDSAAMKGFLLQETET